MKENLVHFHKKLLIYSPFILINIMIIFVYLTYVGNFLFDFQKEDKVLYNNLIIVYYSPFKEIFAFLFIFVSIFTFLTLFCFFKTAFTNPGYLPSPIEFEIKYLVNPSKNLQEERCKFISKLNNFCSNGPMNSSELMAVQNKINKYFVDQTFSLSTSELSGKDTSIISVTNSKKDNEKAVLCPSCVRWKPERCHHCKQCNKCVIKMDHHCPWLANCVGYFNYKYFILTLIYGCLSSIIIFFTFLEYIITINISTKYSILFCICNTFAFFCDTVLLMFDMYLLYSNWSCIFHNMTTIEKADLARFNSKTKPLYKYDKGIYKNLKDVFGESILLWFLPFQDKQDGLNRKY